MRALVQRVAASWVEVDGQRVAEIGAGALVFVGVTHSDGVDTARNMARRIAGLRIFQDSAGKMNRSVQDAGGEVLVVSQFTLYADTSRGRRPSFVGAADPEAARPLVDALCSELESLGLQVGRGVFGSHMKVHLVNDGPVTIPLDSER